MIFEHLQEKVGGVSQRAGGGSPLVCPIADRLERTGSFYAVPGPTGGRSGRNEAINMAKQGEMERKGEIVVREVETTSKPPSLTSASTCVHSHS
jgi:hypothetical protein